MVEDWQAATVSARLHSRPGVPAHACALCVLIHAGTIPPRALKSSRAPCTRAESALRSTRAAGERQPCCDCLQQRFYHVGMEIGRRGRVLAPVPPSSAPPPPPAPAAAPPACSCVRLPCGHQNCAGCLRQHCSVHVKEGTLHRLVCPEPGCRAALPPQVRRRKGRPGARERMGMSPGPGSCIRVAASANLMGPGCSNGVDIQSICQLSHVTALASGFCTGLKKP